VNKNMKKINKKADISWYYVVIGIIVLLTLLIILVVIFGAKGQMGGILDIMRGVGG